MFFHHSGSFREAPLYHIYSTFNDMTSTKLTHENKEARSVELVFKVSYVSFAQFCYQLTMTVAELYPKVTLK